MSLTIASLNSGSNGNCYYVGNEQDAVLIDAGISCREINRRMERLGLSLLKVRGVFISHEHGDHIRGAEVLSRKHRVPVYITETTLRSGKLWIEKELVQFFSGTDPVSAGSLTVHPFPKLHDGIDPYSFLVTGNGLTVGVFTDIGEPCEVVIERFGRCNAAFLEANYDEAMLREGSYPFHLKQRIRSNRGHLSNDQALELFTLHRASSLELLLLSHLSAENNDPRLVVGLFAPHANGTRVAIASRHEPSEVYRVSSAGK